MIMTGISPDRIEPLRRVFGIRVQRDAMLSRFTSARIGGPADYLLLVRSARELSQAAGLLWESGLEFRVLGGGSNVLVADAGFRGVVLINQAREVRFEETDDGPQVWCESGASLGGVGRRSVERGWTGLEWTASIPGTVGGAVVGNSGAHGGQVADVLKVAEILQRNGSIDSWSVDRLGYGYRDSWFKSHPGEVVVLSATFRLEASSVRQTGAKMAAFVEYRQETQPPGASWGSMFKNPPDDYAGRLIEACGLKGLRQGQTEISQVHANFFINRGRAKASDVLILIEKAREAVAKKFGVELELEVEKLGDWEGKAPEPGVEEGEG
jgi:UDP-N-acetylmuramate dehydrogenase